MRWRGFKSSVFKSQTLNWQTILRGGYVDRKAAALKDGCLGWLSFCGKPSTVLPGYVKKWSVEVFSSDNQQRCKFPKQQAIPTLFWCVAARIIDIAIQMESCIPTCHLLFLRAGNFLARAFWMQQILAKVSEICCTIQGTNISHLWKRIKSWTQKCFGKGYVIVSWRVSLWILNSSRCWGACDCQITLGEGFKMTLVNGK